MTTFHWVDSSVKQNGMKRTALCGQKEHYSVQALWEHITVNRPQNVTCEECILLRFSQLASE